MMNLVGTELKVFPMLSSPNAGEREAAAHQFYNSLEKRGTNCLELMENHVPLPDYEQAVKDFDEAAKLNNQLSADYDKLNRKYQAINVSRTALLWLQLNWKRCATGAVLLGLAWGGFEHWDQQSHAAERNTVNAQMAKALDRIAAGQNLRYTGDYSSSSVVQIDGKPYWTILYGVTEEGTHTDANGHLLVLHCTSLFAAPATSDMPNAYQAPRPFNAVGWLRWPERARQCRVVDDAKERKVGNDQQIGNNKPAESPDAGTLESPRRRFERIFRFNG